MSTAKPTCITCKLLFETNEAQRDHHKTDLHRFNLKRKVANLPPVTEEVFKTKVEAMEQTAQETQRVFQCTLCHKTFSSDKAFQQHLGSKLHLKQAQKKPEQNPKEVTTKAALAAEQKARADALNERTEDDIVKEKLSKAKHFKPEECLFCSHASASLEENLAHMTREHSFFIPDLEFCTNVEGLIKYLGQKIGVGGVCLFCLKEFSNAEACQHHMRDQAHSRIRYDEDDEEEYLDYYDFSSTYEGVEPGDGDGELASDAALKKHRIELTDLGHELVLPDGRTIGHRDYAIYYRQHFRAPDQREAVLVGKLMAQYRAIGYTKEWHSSHSEMTRKHLKQQAREKLRMNMNHNKLYIIRPQIGF